MTEIALRTYDQEIKDLVEHGHFEEAIAHCQHVLETFPRHVETYRLLGKAFLEQGRHGDAADVFQRVLSAMPDDWLAHVAMSIVREDESNLDMAIWHMERAYEVNPSNSTVQQEIRRLRGRRDGVEPAKLRLTRSALARMYIKGGLFGQAIAEIRQALTEDPDRPDLLILLAGALKESGAVQEAAEICNTLLQKLPYCLEANRILGMVLWTTDKKEDAEKLFQRLESLDPYIDVDAMKSGRQEERPAHTVMIAHMEWEHQQKTTRKKQPNWASSLGVRMEDAAPNPTLPDWLAVPAQPASSAQAAMPPAAQSSAGATPDWLMDAETSMAASSSTPAPSLSSLTDAPGISPAPSGTGDLPDWIKVQSPAETGTAPEAASSLPDWLSAPTSFDAPLPTAPAPAKEDVPDWIRNAAPPENKPDAVPQTDGGLPDWLSTPPPPAVEGLPSSSLPEWEKPETTTGPLSPESAAGLPGWLSTAETNEEAASAEPDWLNIPTTPPSTGGSLPGWMQGVTPSASAPSGTTGELIPDWLKPEPPAAAPPPVDILPDWMRSEEAAPADSQRKPAASPPSASAGSPADLPDWMKPEPESAAAASVVPVPPSAEITPARPPVPEILEEPAVSSPPEWLGSPPQAPESVSATEHEPDGASVIPSGQLPDWLKGPTETGGAEAPSLGMGTSGGMEAVPSSEIPDWLRNAAPAFSPSGSEPEPKSEQPPAVLPADQLPDWLRSTAPPGAQPLQPMAPAPGVTPQASEGTTSAIPSDQLPDWLRGSALPDGQPSQPVSKTPAPPVAESLPDWLASPVAPVSSAEPSLPLNTSIPAREVPPEAFPEGLPAVSEAVIGPKDTPAPPPAPEAFEPALVPAPQKPQPAPSGATGLDLPPWLVNQLDSAPAQPEPPTPPSSTPLPDWLKPASGTGGAQPVMDWDLAAQQPVSPAAQPEGETRPSMPSPSAPPGATAPESGQREVPAWLDRSKPGGGDTVARWLDRRLKTSTLSNLATPASGPPAKNPAAPPPASGPTGQSPILPRPPDAAPAQPTGPRSTQMPTWLDSQKPGASDTVVRWIDKRATGQLSMPKPPAQEPPKAPSSPPPVPSAPAAAGPTGGASVPSWLEQQNINPSETVERWLHERPPAESQPAAPSEDTAVSRRATPEAQPPPPAPIDQPRILPMPAPTAATQSDEEEDGAFVPPPEWLQQTLGNVVHDVPPTPARSAATPPAAPGSPEPSWTPGQTDEPPPASTPEAGQWRPIVQPAAEAASRPAARPAKKKSRKITEVEAEVLLREARVYLETDLAKAADAFRKIIDLPSMADLVVKELESYLEQDPSSGILWNLLGDAYNQVGRLQDAYRAYAEALRKM